jgi:ATP-binding cassette, subfamily B, multidrug efflux pump
MSPFATIKQYLIQNRWYIAAGFVALIIVDVLQLLVPRVFKYAVDELTAGTATTDKLLNACWLLVGCGLTICVFRFCWRICLIGTSRRIEMHLRDRLFSHLIRLPMSIINARTSGDSMARMTNDLESVRMCFGIGMVAFFDTVFLGTAALGFLCYISPVLTLFAMLPMFVIMCVTWRLSPALHRRFKTVQSTFSEMTEKVREALSAVWVVKAYAMEGHISGAFGAVSQTYIQRNLSLVRVMGVFFPLIIVCANLSIAILLAAGGRMTIAGSISTGDFVAFSSYLWILIWPMMALGWVVNLYQRGRASMQRINELLDMPAEDLTAEAEPVPERLDITIRDLSFAYAPDMPAALRNISVTLPQGSIIGITGTTASGKTTLCSLLLRFYDPPPGTVFIGGRDIREMPLAGLRRLFSYVPQDSFLFSQSLARNIAFGCDGCDDEVERCAADAQMLHDIQKLSRGFETVVGEKGVTLSGGQRQRVCIARALITAAPIMILDDAASSLDVETTRSLTARLREVGGDKTMIIISNRIATIEHADMILVLDSGCLLQTGTHAQLIACDGLYRRLFLKQQLEEEGV